MCLCVYRSPVLHWLYIIHLINQLRSQRHLMLLLTLYYKWHWYKSSLTHLGVHNYICRSCIYASLCLRRMEEDLWWALSGSTQLASKESVSVSLSTNSVAPSCFTATKSLSQLFQWHLIGCICHAYICFSALAFPLQCCFFFLRKNYVFVFLLLSLRFCDVFWKIVLCQMYV